MLIVITFIYENTIIRIGNLQGIRIPKLLLEQSGLSEEVELEVQTDQIVIRSATYPRKGGQSHFIR